MPNNINPRKMVLSQRGLLSSLELCVTKSPAMLAPLPVGEISPWKARPFRYFTMIDKRIEIPSQDEPVAVELAYYRSCIRIREIASFGRIHV